MQRHGLDTEPPIIIRNEAPESLRSFLVTLYGNNVRLYLGTILDSIRDVCAIPFSQAKYTEYTEISSAIAALTMQCEWFHVYAAIEEVYRKIIEMDEFQQHSPARLSGLGTEPLLNRDFLSGNSSQQRPVYERSQLDANGFAKELNRYFRANGIGWQLADGKVEYRGNDDFEITFDDSLVALDKSGLTVARRELMQARTALSIRPEPNLSGAVTNSMNAWLSVSRAIIGNENADPGEILRRKPDLMPRPMDQAIKNLWGYSSQYGRKASETKVPTFHEAELVVHVSAAATTYLVRKSGVIKS